MWENKRSRFKKPDQEYYSIANKLRSENKINERFEIMLSSLTLEEIIGLRLELAAKSVKSCSCGFGVGKVDASYTSSAPSGKQLPSASSQRIYASGSKPSFVNPLNILSNLFQFLPFPINCVEVVFVILQGRSPFLIAPLLV